MTRAGYPFTAAAQRDTLPARLFAVVIALVFVFVVLLFDTLLLAVVAAAVLAAGLRFGVRAWWRKRRGRTAAADRTIDLAASDYEVIPRQPGPPTSPEDEAS